MTSFETLTFTEHFPPNVSGVKVLFVFACGYEERSTSLVRKLNDKGALASMRTLAFTFSDYTDVNSAPANRELLRALGIQTVAVPNGGVSLVETKVRELIDEMVATGGRVRVVVDYSSMPRRWYCALLLIFMKQSSVEAHFWYVQGKFPSGEYPCVGYGDFKVFSGHPHVTRTKEVHVFGLGLDSTRTYGIWNFLDPQHTCCLIGASAFNQDLVDKVSRLNHEILLAAEVIEKVRFDDFARLLAAIVDLSRKCTDIGDVCLVADGPKPLVLAMSIVPHIFRKAGVSSWHVAHVKPDGYLPIDVQPTDYVYGFSVASAKAPPEQLVEQR